MKLIPEVQKIVSGYYSLCQDYASTEANGRLDDMALAIQNAVAAKCVEIADERQRTNAAFAEEFDEQDQQTLVDRALANAAEAERIRDALRSHFQLPEK